MVDNSPNLSLPYLLASQSQKHVTINEALNIIDGVLMLCVKSRNLASPPSSPNDADRYIIGANASQAWASKSGQIAVYQNLGWAFMNPKPGFIAFCEDEEIFLSYNNQAWSPISTNIGDIQNAQFFGLGTTADANNPLAAKLNKALFSAKYASENGNGDIQLTLNKESQSKKAAILFQTNWSGRAEFGLNGNDSFGLKTSSDGANWNEVFTAETQTNRLSLFGINMPPQTVGENDFIKQGIDYFFHTFKANNSDGYNLFIGALAGNKTMAFSSNAVEASRNIGIGTYSLHGLTSGYANCAFGAHALANTTSGLQNCAFGVYANFANSSGDGNCAFGYGAGYSNSSGTNNVSVGRNAAYSNSTGSYNCAIGNDSLANNSTGFYNSALGLQALRYKTDGSANINFSNCTGIGYDARVSASNQIQLGGTGTTCYAFGAVQDRSDQRDKADIRDCTLGLEFVNALRPVDFKWDLRDDYFESDNKIDENGNQISSIKAIKKDGSKKRSRFHHGLIAQEVGALLAKLNTDFGGLQDHSINGGTDVQSIGYTELIAPMIKAIQELSEKVTAIEQSNN